MKINWTHHMAADKSLSYGAETPHCYLSIQEFPLIRVKGEPPWYWRVDLKEGARRAPDETLRGTATIGDGFIVHRVDALFAAEKLAEHHEEFEAKAAAMLARGEWIESQNAAEAPAVRRRTASHAKPKAEPKVRQFVEPALRSDGTPLTRTRA